MQMPSKPTLVQRFKVISKGSLTPPSSEVGPSESDLEGELFADDLTTDLEPSATPAPRPEASEVVPAESELEAELFADNLMEDAEPSVTFPISPGYGSQRSCGPAE